MKKPNNISIRKLLKEIKKKDSILDNLQHENCILKSKLTSITMQLKDANEEKAKVMHRCGRSIGEISKKLGMSSEYVRAVINLEAAQIQLENRRK